MLFREATSDDVESIVALSSMLFAEDAGVRDSGIDVRWPEVEGEEYFSAVISAPDCLCIVAEREHTVVGYIVGRIYSGNSMRPLPVADLESIYVAPEYRSGGVGEKLVREFLIWSEERGIPTTTVTAYRTNERAVSFYERLGFEAKKVTLERHSDTT